MKTYSIYTFLLLMGCISLNSCQKFEDLQKDPAAVYTPAPKLIMTSILMRAHDAPWSEDHRHNQYMTQNEAYYTGQTYGWTTGSYDNHYNILRDVYRMEKEAVQNGDRGGIYLTMAKFFKAYFYYRATSMFGEIPMSEAMQGESNNNFSPKYNTQEEIFAQILTWLDEANTELANSTLAGNSLEGDFFFNGNLNKWQKTVNSFKLRVLVSLSKRANDAPALRVKERFAELLNNPSKYPLILTNEDNFQLLYNSINPYPLWPADGIIIKRDIRNTLGATYVNILRNSKDPRLMIQALPASGITADPANPFNVYQGGSTGDLQSTLLRQAGDGKLSMINFDYWLSSPSGIPSVQLGASEVHFALAEGINRGWATGDAAAHFQAGIRTSMSFYGVTSDKTEAFLKAYPYAGNTTTGLDQILTQKYVAFFENSGKQAYFEQRRTGIPVFSVGPANANNNEIPKRWAYPTTEYSTNEANLKESLQRQFKGSDTQNDIMWIIK
ncbi:SusD/RagB family nutrient-binding outer membrane lipoprotein [Sphingobacterium spiritivorum]|uniref:SusD/RagB family nutrient-binding outer membrane lipoprotein n=1 Tax=Sphingobacterium spiritivorum TaxID=258 RepID=UPI001917C2FD|nr:SusD/RagB family nutrient-binding outer membrane lipoprotein [Sphingobacterium spiritivorum]QQT26398.1 SusD/RagB family nutrient-binding outer membrane lipoprotein [Sphingobacterium spiritivorum]